MERIASFNVDHTKLKRGLYVSRKDNFNDVVLTTFDIRMKAPNVEPVMDTAIMHTIEHLGATYLRNNDACKSYIVYFGPMGCRTGCYLIVAKDYSSKDILQLIIDMFKFIIAFEGKVPGASKEECGNYLDGNLDMAKYESRKYLNEVLLIANEFNLNYPK